MTKQATPRKVSSHAGLGPLPKTEYTLASGFAVSRMPGYSADQMRAYAAAAVAQWARHYRRSPDSLHGAEMEADLLHLLRARQLTRSTVNQAGSAINFLLVTVLGREGTPCRIPLPHGPQRLPEILSRDE
ncbi:MAG: phage integrase N-terminal SAM-like domain-containing protein, partial [Betaproteobacteria bacterium]